MGLKMITLNKSKLDYIWPFNAAQAEVLGVPYHGTGQRKLMGLQISRDQWLQLIALKGVTKSKKKKPRAGGFGIKAPIKPIRENAVIVGKNYRPSEEDTCPF